VTAYPGASMIHRALDLAAGTSERLLAPLARWSEAPAQSRVVTETAHRPWPLPPGSWVQAQTWRDLLFAHWRVDADALRGVVPPELPIDTFDGSAWLAVTPFEVTGLRLRGTWPPPSLSRFPETNVRTYTSVHDKPGIYFFSLDAASRLAVLGARRTYRLPYFHARMSIERSGSEVSYSSRRTTGEASLRARYRPVRGPSPPRPGTLEHFLTERYCLYTVDERRCVHRAEIHHPPWPLQRARAELEVNTMAAPLGFELAPEEALLHFSARQDVVIWPPQPVT
jgi:uncharacterized protein YqjF (DUF2071 family)